LVLLPGLRRGYEVLDGGGLTAEGRARREKVRLQAAQMFEQGIKPAQVARLLRVSTKSAYQWRRSWRSGGDAALASKGRAGTRASWTKDSWPGYGPRWTLGRQLTAGKKTSGGRWPG